MSDLDHALRKLEESRFYGTVELKYESGRIVLIRKTETIKPTEASYGNNRSASNDRNR